jgi:ubiquinone/menaquinone biosynthesis C-methylase UbiE
MGIIGFLKDARAKTLDRNPSADHFTNKFYSGTSYALWCEINRRIRENIRGRILDAGCGRGGWKEVIESTGATRESLDILQYGGTKLDWLADLTNMPQVPSEHFDSVACNQVLEHVLEPEAALLYTEWPPAPAGKNRF